MTKQNYNHTCKPNRVYITPLEFRQTPFHTGYVICRSDQEKIGPTEAKSGGFPRSLKRNLLDHSTEMARQHWPIIGLRGTCALPQYSFPVKLNIWFEVRKSSFPASGETFSKQSTSFFYFPCQRSNVMHLQKKKKPELICQKILKP